MKVNCMFCRKEYLIDSTDPQYYKLFNNITKSYICKDCNTSLKNESIKVSDINPNQLDKHEKFNL